MDLLTQLVAVMTKEEVRHLKLYLSRIETQAERKDEKLFDYIRTNGQQYDEAKIHRKLYGEHDKNAFYRLRGRLQDVICQNLAMLHESKNDKNKLFLYFSVFHIFFTTHVPKMAFGENTKDLRSISHRYNAEYQGVRTALKSLR